MDPSGKQIKPFSGPPWSPYPYPSSPLPIPSVWAPTPPPRNPFDCLAAALYGLCSTCCSSQECECDGDSFAIANVLNNVWNTKYNQGPMANPGWDVWWGQHINWWMGEDDPYRDDSVGGYYCNDWAEMFEQSVSTLDLNSSCFKFERLEITNKANPKRIHQFVKITVGSGGNGCEFFVDDGWGNGSSCNAAVPIGVPSDWTDPHLPTL